MWVWVCVCAKSVLKGLEIFKFEIAITFPLSCGSQECGTLMKMQLCVHSKAISPTVAGHGEEHTHWHE